MSCSLVSYTTLACTRALHVSPDARSGLPAVGLQAQHTLRKQLDQLCGLQRSSVSRLSPRNIETRRVFLPSNAVAVDAPTSSVEEEREALKSRLYHLLKESGGIVTDEIGEVVAALEKINPTVKATRNDYKGVHETLSAVSNVRRMDAPITLGLLTFNTFKPNSLTIRLGNVLNIVGREHDMSYVVETPITVIEEGLPQLKGEVVNMAELSVVESEKDRVEVLFKSSILRPAAETDLAEWKKVFLEANEGMDAETGVLELQLPPAKGWLDYIYVDKDIRITRGNRGTIVIVKRV